ncbi:MAG TPA: hypothetical protein VFD43_00240 [Planctomycetota bacterium]|nr:hypothetical protein [Planctomycetota bacterium]
MTIDRKLILDASQLKLAHSVTRMTTLYAWMDEAMSTLAVNEALAIPLNGANPKRVMQAARMRLHRLGGALRHSSASAAAQTASRLT